MREPPDPQPTSQSPAPGDAQIPPEPASSQVGFLLGGVALAILSQMLRSQSYIPTVNGFSTLILILGVLFFIIGLHDQTSARKNILYDAVNWLGLKLKITTRQVMFFILSLTCALLAASAADTGPILKNPALAVGCWMAGIGLGFLGGWTPGPFKRPLPWKILAWTAALILLAFPIRAIDTAHIPAALTGDEASFGLGGVGFLQGAWNNIFFLNWYSFPALYFLIPAGSIQILGQTIPALRLPSALAGSLTVGGVYLLGRLLYNHRAGLFGALFLAGLHFHIHFSRLGINNIWDGLFFVLAAGAFWRAWQTGRRIYFLITGFLTGLGLYFYITAKILPILLVAWVIIFWFIDRSRLKRYWPDLVFMFCMAGVVAAPLGWVYLKNPNEFLAPFSRVLVTNSVSQGNARDFPAMLLMLIMQIVDGFRGYTDLATRSWYLSGVPVLRPIYAAFFSLGFIPLLLRFRDGRTWLLITWAACIAIAGGLSESTPAAQRYVAGAPVAALIAGTCLSEIGNRIQKVWPRRRPWILGASALIVAVAMASDLIFYFGDYIPLNARQDINTKIAQRLADYLQPKRGDWQVVFYGEPIMGFYSISSIHYLVPNIPGIDARKPWGDPANPVPTAQNVIFVFIREHDSDLALAQQTYPGGKLVTQTDPALGLLAWIYELSPFQPNP